MVGKSLVQLLAGLKFAAHHSLVPFPKVSYLYCINSIKALSQKKQKQALKKNEKQKHYIMVWTTATGDINHPGFGCSNCKGTRAHRMDLPEFLI